jgi:hypothetical protein
MIVFIIPLLSNAETRCPRQTATKFRAKPNFLRPGFTKRLPTLAIGLAFEHPFQTDV